MESCGRSYFRGGLLSRGPCIEKFLSVAVSNGAYYINELIINYLIFISKFYIKISSSSIILGI